MRIVSFIVLETVQHSPQRVEQIVIRMYLQVSSPEMNTRVALMRMAHLAVRLTKSPNGKLARLGNFALVRFSGSCGEKRCAEIRRETGLTHTPYIATLRWSHRIVRCDVR